MLFNKMVRTSVGSGAVEKAAARKDGRAARDTRTLLRETKAPARRN